MDIKLTPETGDPKVTLENLRKYTSAGLKVKKCLVKGNDIIVVFDKGEYHAVGFRVGEPCQPFAEFAIEAGLEEVPKTRIDEIERFLMTMPPEESQGEIIWLDLKNLPKWKSEWNS